MSYNFEWDEKKNFQNMEKHDISFYEAQKTFKYVNRIIIKDLKHSEKEERYFCIGRINKHIMTVRFTVKDNLIRIFGAGYWRKGKKIYEKENKIY